MSGRSGAQASRKQASLSQSSQRIEASNIDVTRLAVLSLHVGPLSICKAIIASFYLAITFPAICPLPSTSVITSRDNLQWDVIRRFFLRIARDLVLRRCAGADVPGEIRWIG